MVTLSSVTENERTVQRRVRLRPYEMWMAHSRPGELSSKAGALEDIPNPLAGLWQGWGTGGFFEGVYQVDTCICLMYIFQEVYCLSACSNRFARSASKQSGEQNECGTPSLYLRFFSSCA